MGDRNTFLRSALYASAVLAPCFIAQTALAQRANENAVANADDAFGTQTGGEASGIYNENETRGLNPLKAGNARLDGLYFDPVAAVTGRTRASYAIRVGIAANSYPFPAPTGIVDNRLRAPGNKLGGNLALTRMPLGGDLEELDLSIPVVKDTFGVYAGISHAHPINSDGSYIDSIVAAVRPVLHVKNAEFTLLFAPAWTLDMLPRPVFVATGDQMPSYPNTGHILNQPWASNRNFQLNAGGTMRMVVFPWLSFRAGLFRSGQIRNSNYTEIYRFSSASTMANHILISDPRQDIHSLSGEAQFALRFDGPRWHHRIIAGYRARDRYTESGGSDGLCSGAAKPCPFSTFDTTGTDIQPEPVFHYSAVNVGRVKQSAVMLGYLGQLAHVGHVSLGLQRARYRATFLDAASGTTTRTSDDTWLYNASFAVHLTKQLEFYAGTQHGLEDSGAAPENAANRNEQLPTTRSTQYEGGLRWHVGKNQVVASLFQITRPYFSFDRSARYVELGTASYRGAELSLVGHFKRLTALAGAVVLKSEVTGPGRDLGILGEKPVGPPNFYSRVDLQYRTDILGGLTPSVTLVYTGERAGGSAPLASLGGKQLTVPAYATVDFGLRQRFKLGNMPVVARASLQNAFNAKSWKITASNSFLVEDRRRFMLYLNADF